MLQSDPILGVSLVSVMLPWMRHSDSQSKRVLGGAARCWVASEMPKTVACHSYCVPGWCLQAICLNWQGIQDSSFSFRALYSLPAQPEGRLWAAFNHPSPECGARTLCTQRQT